MEQVGSIPNSGRLDYETWLGRAVERNGRLAGRLGVVREGDWLGREDRQKLRRKAHALRLCSRERWIQFTPGGQAVPGPRIHCGDRLCPVCTARRTHRWQDRLKGWVTPDGRTRRDGTGRLKGTRTWDEITADAAAKAWRVLRSGQPADDMAVQLAAIDQAAHQEAATRVDSLYLRFATLTIPNIPHVWMLGIGRDILDTVLLRPFRRMWDAIKRRRNRAKKKELRTTYDPGRRQSYAAIQRARQGQRRHWTWRRPKGRHYLLGLSYLTRWLGHVIAGETTHTPKTGYHPHLHILIWSRRPYLSQGILRHVWRHYTGNPAIKAVQVQAADPLTVGSELAKYLTKLDKTQSIALQEIARAWYGRRSIWTGGIAYGVQWSRQTAEQAQMQRLSERPLSKTGRHVQRRWMRGQWQDTPMDIQAPVKTAEQWAHPLTVAADGERVTVRARDAALDRRALTLQRPHRTAWWQTDWDEQDAAQVARQNAVLRGLPTRPARWTPERLQFYLSLAVWIWLSKLWDAVWPVGTGREVEAGIRALCTWYDESCTTSRISA
ncbi:hypothetical protein TPY_3210 [Sulfobacillus acidophilus TPY]|nr:hypothetical protein TPY_3210 [Sulfobacillus acidophilus TPY]